MQTDSSINDLTISKSITEKDIDDIINGLNFKSITYEIHENIDDKIIEDPSIIPKQLNNPLFKFCKIHKGTKIPFEFGWQKNGYSYGEIINWVKDGNNYGVLGGFGDLVIPDADCKQTQEIIDSSLPNTFSVRTKNGNHYYYFCNGIDKKIVFDDSKSIEKNLEGKAVHLGEVISYGSQVVGPNSVHPSGSIYKVVNDVPIATITKEQLFEALGSIMKEPVIAKQPTYDSSVEVNSIRIEDVIAKYNIKLSSKGKNLVGYHPIHGSEGGNNFHVDTVKQVWYCFRHNVGGNTIHLIAIMEGIIDCEDAGKRCLDKEKFLKTLKAWGIEPYKSNAKSDDSTTHEKDTRLVILKTGVLKSDLCRQVFAELKKKDVFFRYGGGISKIIEVEKLDAKTDKNIKTAILEEVTNAGFITDIEKYFIPQTTTDKGNIKDSSFNESDARIILKSNDNYQLSEICGFSPFKLPYRKNDKLLFTDVGYNSDKQIYTELFAPMIEFMEIDKAISIVRDLFSEFCFLEHELDLSRAVSYILSPALTLLTYNRRAMCFLADGNREGVGKDYLLGIPYLIYENTQPIFSAPCNSDDEYRKFLFAACADNQKIIIFSNLKGYLDSKAFEHFCTSQVIKDRVLCESKNREYPNTGLYGMSGNGVSFSPDMERRIMHIRMEYYQEQIKDRQFKRSLYDYISINRQEILNAIYTLIKHWFDNGAVFGKKIPSFEEWSSIVSGILISNGFKNPFDERKVISHSLSVGGNTEDSDIKQLVLSWWRKHNKLEVRAEDLRTIAEDLFLFRNLDLDTKAGQITFSRLITKRADRIYANNRIKVFRMEKYTKFCLEEATSNGDKEDKED